CFRPINVTDIAQGTFVHAGAVFPGECVPGQLHPARPPDLAIRDIDNQSAAEDRQDDSEGPYIGAGMHPRLKQEISRGQGYEAYLDEIPLEVTDEIVRRIAALGQAHLLV